MGSDCCPNLLDPTPLLFWCAVACIAGLALLTEAGALWLSAPVPHATGRLWVARAIPCWQPWLALPLLVWGFWSLGVALASAAAYWTFGQDGRYGSSGGDPAAAAHVPLAIGLFTRVGILTALGGVVLLAVGWLALTLSAARAGTRAADA